MSPRSLRHRATFALTLCSALLALPGAAFADGVAIEEASPAQLKAAQKTFEAADDLYDNKQYDAAIKAFRTSFEIVASPNSQLMIARCWEGLGKPAEAYAELESAAELAEKAAAKDAKYAPTLKAVRDELAALKSKVGEIRLDTSQAPPGTTVTVGGKTIDGAALAKPVIVAPGNTTIVARAEGYAELRRDVDVSAGGDANVEIQLAKLAGPEPEPTPLPETTPPAPADRPSGSPLRTAAFVAGGFGAANLIGFLIFGAIHNGKYSDLEDGCSGGRCPADLEDTIDSGKTFQTLANTSLVLGAVGIGAGVTLFVLSTRSASKAPSSSAAIAAGPGTIRLMGRF